MAQLSGVMTADFSDFMFEIDKSVVKLKDLEGAAGHTDNAMGDFSQGLGVADKTLNALGVHIGPQIQAVRELGNVAGLTFEKLGLWGSLGAIGTAFAAGWQVGKWIDDWTGFSTAVGDATASLLGFGDVAAQRAGAGMDVLNRATQIAGRTIKDFDQAMQIIKQHNLEVAESFNTGASRVERWNRELAAHKDDLPTITAELKNHSSTVAQLSQQYGISADAITYYTTRTKENSAILERWHANEQAALDKSRKAQEELNNAGLGWQTTVAAIAPATAALVQHYLNLDVSVQSLATVYGLTTTQVEALDKQMKFNLATMAATEPALGSLDQWIKTNVGDTKEWNNEWRFTSEVIDNQVIPSLDAVTTKAQEVSQAVAAVTGVSPGMDQKSPGGAATPINTGNITYQGGFESVFAEFIRKQGGGGGALGGAFTMTPQKDFLSWALSMGLAQRTSTITNTFNLVDTQDGLARKVGDTITDQIQRGSLVN